MLRFYSSDHIGLCEEVDMILSFELPEEKTVNYTNIL
jgi:hypothetical protein